MTTRKPATDRVNWYTANHVRAQWRRPRPLIYVYTPDTTARQRMGVERALARWQDPIHIPGIKPVTLARPFTHGDAPGSVAILIGPAHLTDVTLNEAEFTYPAPGVLGPGEATIDDVSDPDHLERVVYWAPRGQRAAIVGLTMLFQDDADAEEIAFGCAHGWGHAFLLAHSSRTTPTDVMRATQGTGYPSRAELLAVRGM